MRGLARNRLNFALLAALCGGCGQVPSSPRNPDPKERLQALTLPADAPPPHDPTNAFADDPRAAALGKKFFFDRRFAGPLLDDANNGLGGTLGMKGETGKVACADCHLPENRAFVDTRSPRRQLSFASGWTHRKAPTLLDVAQAKFLTWDGRRGTAFSQPFAPVESPLEFNSSRLFVAQQIARFYKDEYEAIFGPLPSLEQYPILDAADAGCREMPADPVHETCEVPGRDDDEVTRVVVNFGKAIQAYTRLLSCGRSRFDDWLDGDDEALTPDEQAGAVLFVTKAACDGCHSGPYLTDQRFHNVGVGGRIVPFTGVNTANDPGAATALASLLRDPLNSKGIFSDGDDGRLESLPEDLTSLEGSFRTASLRCVSRRPSFMHDGQFRTLDDVVTFFNEGGADTGYVGSSENYARGLTSEEQAQLVAFLRALDGSGPDPALIEPPSLP